MHTDIKFKLLKFIDHWCGAPLCVFLGVLHRVVFPFDRGRPAVDLSRPVRAILVIKFFGLGSIVLASSLLKGIKKKYPHAKLIFLTFKYNADLVKRLGLCDEIRVIDTRNPLTFVLSTWAYLVHAIFNRVDVAVDLEFYSKYSTLLSYFSGAPSRVGFYIARFWRSALVNVQVYFNHARHILEIYGMVGTTIGADVENLSPEPIPVDTHEASRLDKILKEKKITKDHFLLGVNVNASDLAHCREWSKENFAQTIERLVRKHPQMKVILTGGRTETRHTAAVLDLINGNVKSNVFDLSGKLTLGEFLELLRRTHLFLTNDSGPFHLAKAQGTPTVSIWGPGSPALYGPYQKEGARHRVIYKSWPCSPCLYIYRTDAGRFCKKTAPCLKEIQVAEVVTAVTDAMQQKGFMR